MKEWYLRMNGRCSENGKAERTSWTVLTGVSRRHDEQSIRRVPVEAGGACDVNSAIFPIGSWSGGRSRSARMLGCRALGSVCTGGN
jgi:hypothetical protein